jgi:DNA-binding beta-propeller fold protein YncE
MARYVALVFASVLLSAAAAPANVGAGAPSSTISHPHHHGWMARDANPKHAWMYVASGLTNPILIYDLESPVGPRKIGEITDGLTRPSGIAVDAQGTLYAANYNQNQPGGTVTIYPAGATSPSLTLSQGLSAPLDVKVDTSGNVYVSNHGTSPSIAVFPPGQTTPSEIITSSLIQAPGSMTLDSSQNLFFGDGISGVLEIPYGTQQPVSVNLQGLERPGGLTFDPLTGNLFVADLQLNKVFVYAPNNENAVRTMKIGFGSCIMADGTIKHGEYIFVPDCGTSGTVLVFKHNANKPITSWSFDTGIGACCIAFKPAGVP